MHIFKRPAKGIAGNIVLIIELAFLISFGWYCIRLGIVVVKTHKENRIDAKALYSVVAEAEANIKEDPDFVNPADTSITKIPDKYYSYVESARGYGRAYVTIDPDGTLDAYFGYPEFDLAYYSEYLDDSQDP